MKMDTSILIPNHSDLRMIHMIESIDYFDCDDHRVELVIVLNRPTNAVREQVEKIKKIYNEKFIFKVVHVSKCNLGLVYNEGIKQASFDNIMFIDTDLTCARGAIEKTISTMRNELIVKAKIVYKGMDRLVERARLVNTTETILPYIPVILINRNIFYHLKDDYMFAVDTVWCSDAEFAYRVINEKIKINYTDAEFYHDKISIKKDLKDAVFYGFGKGIRIKRTREKWKPFSEIVEMYKIGKEKKLNFLENGYSILWIMLQQLACFIQLCIPIIFKESIAFENSESIKNIEVNKDNEEN